MHVAPFEPTDAGEVRRIGAARFARMRLDAFLWQPCQQVESLEKDCPKYVYRDGASVVAYAAAYALDETHFRLNLIVDPRHAGRGIGTLLISELESDIRERGGRYLQARLLEGAEASLGFALARGFEEIHRMRGMSLSARDFSYARWQMLGEKLSAHGYALTTLRDEAESGVDAVERLADLHRSAEEGWASPDPTLKFTPPGHPHALFKDIAFPDLFSIMKRGDLYVGYTSAKRVNLSATAVRPNHRGLGVATYLKAHNLRLCVAAGESRFETCSASPAMIRVNEKLGYRLNGLVEVRLLKRL
jgi:GNAT superfamily N-acetyltransferase